jgi:Delta3-Delta2-enoyl-CoA isomerase
MNESDPTVVSYTVEGRIATITLNNPKKLNALTRQQWFRLAHIMEEINRLPDVVITVLRGTGKYFSA